jgi:hypothetical protein
MTSLDTCISSRPRAIAGLLTVLVSGLSACSLLSIDPDEIDIAGDSSDGGLDEVGGTDDEAADDGTEGDLGTETDTGTTAADTGNTDGGDTTGGEEGTTGPGSCEPLDEVVIGDNPVVIEAGPSNFQGSCGGSESETLYSFTASANSDYWFSLVGAEFTPVVYVFENGCAEGADACSNTEDSVLVAMSEGDTVIVVVDSDGGVGSATLVVAGL